MHAAISGADMIIRVLLQVSQMRLYVCYAAANKMGPSLHRHCLHQDYDHGAMLFSVALMCRARAQSLQTVTSPAVDPSPKISTRSQPLFRTLQYTPAASWVSNSLPRKSPSAMLRMIIAAFPRLNCTCLLFGLRYQCEMLACPATFLHCTCKPILWLPQSKKGVHSQGMHEHWK